MSKEYSPKVIAIVEAAKAFAEQKKAEGWTRQDFLDGLKEMFESDDGTEPKTEERVSKREWARRRVAEQREWIATHGGDLAGYVRHYGSQTSSKKYGAGGEAIYDADTQALRNYEERLEELERDAEGS